MSQNLNSLKGGSRKDNIGDYYRVIKGDTRSLDYSSHGLCLRQAPTHPRCTCTRQRSTQKKSMNAAAAIRRLELSTGLVALSAGLLRAAFGNIPRMVYQLCSSDRSTSGYRRCRTARSAVRRRSTLRSS